MLRGPYVLALTLGALAACTETPPRKISANGEHLLPAPLPAQPAIHAEVYVPIYSDLSYASGQVNVELSAQLTIRNTDSERPIVLEWVRYFDSTGALLRNELNEPHALAPMATTAFLVRKDDRAGGVGANYLVRWRSETRVSEPLMEAAMVDLSSTYSLAFTSRGVTTRRALDGLLGDAPSHPMAPPGEQ